MASLEDVQARHRRELRELQGRVTNKKKNATKKTRRGVLDECAALELALHKKQAAELQELEGGKDEDEDKEDQTEEDQTEGSGDVGGVTVQLADTTLDGEGGGAETSASPSSSTQPKKRNRQRERLARRAAALEDDQAVAAAEAATMVDHAAVERAVLAPLIGRSGRAEHAIRPDGHCLFAAVADQMAELGRRVRADEEDEKDEKDGPADPYRHVRWAAARYMEAHPDDFAPFLVGDDGLPAHIARIRDTAEWGGQLELRALASAYDVDIHVLHDGRSELIRPASADGQGEDGNPQQTRPTIWLVYYRHGFGLGEHYNSLRAKTEEP
ncbi:otu domain containing protein 6b [Grosmannia clavigera kw1407]|uniref:Otu domain containing protein 6b n=1 Tax=Grosmannia clavigera (strain kw1407 / UAMH 11150) TaxID=655863 RepID=F0XFV7_GROCL|nr:otu domain containing protein 6b [Grosmannia clavigera kw1407]EFX04618.1 otu domain containing protein 6b [Grosmannia clavigera kw1407]